MGRTPSAKKPQPAARSLSSRLGSAQPSTGASTPSAPSPLRFDFGSDPSTATARARSAAMPAQKRAFDDAAGPATPSASGKGKKPRRRGGKAVRAARTAAQARNKNNDDDDGEDDDDDEDEVEEGQVVEGDFADLFMVDTTPAAVRDKDRFVPVAEGDMPLSKAHEGDEEDMLTAPMALEEGRELPADREDKDDTEEDEAMDSDDALRAFAKEIAETEDDTDEADDDDLSGDDEEDEASTPGVPMPLYDNEEDLQKAIEGRIVDDSQAPVTGRYYKEADLTKTCVLCGESGHTSRDCTHSQCFICGAIDADHEARNCPVALVCSACGSRGHYARDCTVNPGPRTFGSSRCALCSSNNHMTPNCPSHWRIYDTSGPKPPKRKVVLACANCGSTKDHFIDDCLLPRGHPMKYADPSAFNRAALGSSYSSAPYSAAPSSSRRKGGATGKLDRRPRGGARDDDDDDDDDDWFASRARAGGPARGGGGAGAGGHGGGRGAASDRAGLGSKPRTHIHFGGDERRGGAGGASRGSGSGYRDRDRDREYASGASGYDSPRDDWRSIYGSGGGGSGGVGRRGGNNGGGGGAGHRDRNGGGGGRLLDRIGGDSGGGPGGGRSGGRQPRYRGGYV
ncbi:hypothetical protein JCM3770_006580 [Rhodotorula araucariae]